MVYVQMGKCENVTCENTKIHSKMWKCEVYIQKILVYLPIPFWICYQQQAQNGPEDSEFS